MKNNLNLMTEEEEFPTITTISLILFCIGCILYKVLVTNPGFSKSAPIVDATNGKIDNIVRFSYGGYSFYDTLSFSDVDYKYYRNLTKKDEFDKYVNEYEGHLYLKQLSKKLDEDASQLGYTGNKMVEYLTAFVQQSIPYVKDPHTGYDYPKYPIETLIEGGDCEDKAALLAALLKVFGFDPKMCMFDDHMAVALTGYGINNFDHDGKKYTFIETTSDRTVGNVPDEVIGKSFDILDVNTSTRYNRGDLPLTNKTLAESKKDTTYQYGNVSISNSVTTSIQVNGVDVHSGDNIPLKSGVSVIVSEDGSTITISN